MSLYLPIAETSVNLMVLLSLGLSVGFLSGMLGIGGGFVITPFLTFLGVPVPIAVGTGAAQVVATSVSGAIAHIQRGNVELSMGLLLVAGGLAGSIFGINLVGVLRQLGQLDIAIALAYVLLLGVIGMLMLIENIATLRAAHGARAQTRGLDRAHHNWIQGLPFKWRFRRSRLYMSIIPPLVVGLVVGILTGLMGVGGGFLVVPAMIYLLRVPTRIVIGTSAFQIVFVTAFATVLQSVQNHAIDITLATPLMLSGVIGAQMGVRLADKVNPIYLRIMLALLLVAVAVRMSVDLVSTPKDPYSMSIPR